MIPSNLAGLVLLVASLGPGYIFVRVVEVRGPRPPRSTFFEAVEMAIVGAVVTTIVACFVLAIGDAFGWLDVSRMLTKSEGYFDAHPLRVLAAVLVTLAVSYVGAALPWAIGRFRTRSTAAAVHKPGDAGWQEMFVTRRPPGTTVVATVELRDGRKLSGQVHGFSSVAHDNRELALGRPIVAGTPPTVTGDTLIVLREQDIAYVSVRYLQASDKSATSPQGTPTEAGQTHATSSPAVSTSKTPSASTEV